MFLNSILFEKCLFLIKIILSQIAQEIQVSLRDERDMKKTRQVVMEREKLIDVIQNKNSEIQYYMVNLKTAKLIISVLRSESRLIQLYYSYLDGVLSFVKTLENSLKQETLKTNETFNKFKTVNLSNSSSLNPVLVGFGSYDLSNKTSTNKDSVSFLTTFFANKQNTYKSFSHLVCSFSKWEEFVKQIELKTSFAYDDLKRLKEIEQNKSSINSRLEKVYY